MTVQARVKNLATSEKTPFRQFGNEQLISPGALTEVVTLVKSTGVIDSGVILEIFGARPQEQVGVTNRLQ